MPAPKSSARQSSARLEARIDPGLHAMLKRAAEIQGSTMTEFMVPILREAARRTISEAEIIRLSLEDQKSFAEALLDSPEPAPALRRAFGRGRELIGNE